MAVDFGHWGGPIVRGCGIDQPSGYALLHAAGFTTAGDAHDGDAFICRIGDQAFHAGTLYPTPSQEQCSATPSTSSYWSYWVAPAGQNRWTYSPLGPMGDLPKPGEVELWMFGATNTAGTRGSGVPSFPPSSLRPASPAPAKHTTAPPKPMTPSATPAASTPPRLGSSHRSTGKPTATNDRRQPRRPTRKRPKPAAQGPLADARPSVVSAKPTDERTSSGSAAPLAAGLTLAFALAAGAVWTVRRRRRYE